MTQSDAAYCTDQVFFSLLLLSWAQVALNLSINHSTNDEATAHFRTGVLPIPGAIFSHRMTLKHEQVLLHTEKISFYWTIQAETHCMMHRLLDKDITTPKLSTPNFQRSASQKTLKKCLFIQLVSVLAALHRIILKPNAQLRSWSTVSQHKQRGKAGRNHKHRLRDLMRQTNSNNNPTMQCCAPMKTALILQCCLTSQNGKIWIPKHI